MEDLNTYRKIAKCIRKYEEHINTGEED